MANFASIFRGASSQSELGNELNKALDRLVIAYMVSSSLVHIAGGSNKGGLVFAFGTGDKLQVEMFQAGSMDGLQVEMQGWIDLKKFELVQLAITYADDKTRAMLTYKSLSSGEQHKYKVTCISKDKPSNMQSAVDAAIISSSVVISDTTYGGGKDRAVLITQ